ncbi:hypothetical protein [Burkholderia gladioli]|uniref:hypothetical protein n=1 Tax=Burkholderia gladioli TaxID=28095 RepID=UPI00187D52A2|nr:hypothetical protein [Burkholderia gladioli]
MFKQLSDARRPPTQWALLRPIRHQMPKETMREIVHAFEHQKEPSTIVGGFGHPGLKGA